MTGANALTISDGFTAPDGWDDNDWDRYVNVYFAGDYAAAFHYEQWHGGELEQEELGTSKKKKRRKAVQRVQQAYEWASWYDQDEVMKSVEDALLKARSERGETDMPTPVWTTVENKDS